MYKLVKLPYSYSALEPYIGENTMFVHYNKHYIGYLNKLNELVTSVKPIKSLIINIDDYSVDVRNNAGGYFNHSLFWNMLRPNTTMSTNLPPNLLQKIIDRDFGSYENFNKKITETAKKRFGSGWVWWILYPNGKTAVVQTPYQDNPLMYIDCEILLGIDVWEHAYYLNYEADRESYVNNIFNILNWDYPTRILFKK
jgi:Fe-Mn family superoxide dismutase